MNCQIFFSRSIILDQLLHYFSEEEYKAALNFSMKLKCCLEKTKGLKQGKVMVAYGGGKDSSYTVAFVRFTQLLLEKKYGYTFQLRVAIMRHAGVPPAVMENINRVFNKLGLFYDKSTELIVVDNNQVTPFQLGMPFPKGLLEINRKDILMNGHRTAGDGRPTFCNSCNLSIANFYGISTWWQGGVDVVITGDSAKEQKQYYAWIVRLGRKLNVEVESCLSDGFYGLLRILDKISFVYFNEVFGEEFEKEIAERRVFVEAPISPLIFLSIYDFVKYNVDAHWELLTQFLEFKFDELAFSFTESDCGNPSLMAHIRGLKKERVYEQNYHDGVREYLELATFLMQEKQIPVQLQRVVLKRYETNSAISIMRSKMDRFAMDSFQLDEKQLICMVYSPFIDKCRRLKRYLEREALGLAKYDEQIRQLLSANTVENQNVDLIHQLEKISGLRIVELRSLYRGKLVNFNSSRSVISIIRGGDPHKKSIRLINPLENHPVTEVISGR